MELKGSEEMTVSALLTWFVRIFLCTQDKCLSVIILFLASSGIKEVAASIPILSVKLSAGNMSHHQKVVLSTRR